jgi:hypothetical protein
MGGDSALAGSPENAMADAIVVDLISEGLAWVILRKAARTAAAAGSQLNAMGGRAGASFAGLDAACTVAEKLARCPAVERVLWLELAADCVRNVIRPPQPRRRAVEVVGERSEVWKVLFEYGVGLRRRENRLVLRDPAAEMDHAAEDLRHKTVYREQFALIVCELSACWAADPAFRAWIESKT